MRMIDAICVLFKFLDYPSPSWKYTRLNIVMVLSILLAPFTSYAFEADIEKDLQADLERSRSIIISIQKKILSGASLSSEIVKLQSTAENIRTIDLLLEERFKRREEKVKALGTKALGRHQVMAEGYRKALTEYLSLIGSLTPSDESQLAKHDPQPATGSSQPVTVKTQQLLDLLNKLLPKKKRPLIGSLPYKHLNYPSQQLTTAASVTPAYLGGNKIVSPDDTAPAPEAPISIEIATLAQSLNWNPVSIYEYVKNNIETEWYWGCMKGAEDTLHQKSGNDCDQATLLAALLRASGYPTRYVRGVIQFFPDIEKAKNLTGIDDPAKIAEFFQKAGVPFNPVVAGGKIANIQIEHVWVESQIPYSNYRGAIIDTMGKTWLGLDTSIKVKGYTYNSAPDILSAMSLSTIRDEYLGLVTVATPSTPFELNQTPLEYLKSSVNAALFVSQPTTTYSDYLRSKTIVPEVLNILPGSLQFTLIKATNEYVQIPDELIHQVKFTATDSNKNELLTITLPSYKLSNQQIAISYEPETVEDQETIDSYGGLDNTPAYLVHLRPVLKVNGERIVVAQGGIPMGGEFNLAIDLISPNGTQSITNSHIVGNLSVIGISAQTAVVTLSPLAGEGGGDGGKDAARLLYEEAMNYNDRWNKAEDELASLLHLSISRPIPSVVTLGGVIDVTYLLDTPYGFTWKGVFIDASERAIETVASDESRAKTLIQLSSLQGSILENRLFEDDFQVESISTAKLFQVANSQAGTSMITIDSTNIATILPTLLFDQNIKEDITNAVNQNLAIRIPQSEMIYQDWTGIGYIKENPDTGESGWMLSGMIAGGMTVWSNDRWPAYYQAILSDPYTEPSIFDPVSAKFIEKISATDLQQAPVGTKLGSPLQVMVHTDQMRPVAGASVTFSIKAGKGSLTGIDAQGNHVAGATVTVPTKESGIASAWLITGQSTTVNSTYWYYPSTDTTRPNPELVGENLVDAQLPSGTGIATPFAAYGFPKAARTMQLLHGDGLVSTILFVSGFASVIIQDEYGNPISNLPITFDALAPEYDATSLKCNPQPDVTKLTYFIPTSEPCLWTAPVWGACGNTNQQSLSRTMTSQGAMAEIMMGGVPYAIYPFKATCTDAHKCSDPATNQLLSVDFKQYTYDYNCGTELYMQTLYPTDTYGNNINAGKTDTPLPVMAKMYYLLNSSVSTTFDTASVTFNGQQGTAQPNGVFTGSHTLTTGRNWVNAQGSATINGKSYTANILIPVYGVDITLVPPPLILLDSFGYAKTDTVIPFTIAPAEYTAMTAYVVILKNGEAIEYIPVEKHGQGYATIGRGFWFDVNSTYAAQLILNSGTGVEIKGDRVTIPVAQMRVVTDESPPKEADEIKFGTGDDLYEGQKNKIYHVNLQSAMFTNNCASLTGKISIINRNGSLATVPTGDGQTYAAEYQLKGNSMPTGCRLQIIDTLANKMQNDFIVSNRSRAALNEGWLNSNVTDKAVLYGGIGNQVKIEINQTQKYIPIEPVSVIVLGIDGLRQDVLYAVDEQQVNELHVNYYVQPSELKGLCEVLGGKFDGMITTHCDATGWENKHIKLKDVTAIFPSITLASWASIFTGKMPNETGITGNEFFARDLYTNGQGVPSRRDGSMTPILNPAGIVSYDSGAFKGYDIVGPSSNDFFIPWQFFWKPTMKPILSPQNDTRVLTAGKTLFESIAEMPGVQKYLSGKDADAVTVAYSHYARGASNWLTFNLLDITSLSWPVASMMDKASWNRFEEYLKGKFLTNNVRNTVPFSPLTVWYLPGLDHNAHEAGMDTYKGYFIDKTDDYIWNLTKWLKSHDEFDNKIFVIVADHGHTAMPTALTYKDRNWLGIDVDKPAEMSCKQKLDFIDPNSLEHVTSAQKAEKANNNLHIWELGELFSATGGIEGAAVRTQYKILVPEEIEDEFVNNSVPDEFSPTIDIDDADIIVALNGPMAHLYSMIGTDNKTLGEIAEAFRVMLSGIYSDEAVKWYGFADQYSYIKFRVQHAGKLRNSVDKMLIRLEDDNYYVFDGLDDNGDPITYSLSSSLSVLDYVDGENRVKGMNNKNRSGDIVLIMKDDVYYPDSESITDHRYTSGVACKSWHGSLNRSDSYVPFIFAYPGGNSIELERILKKDALCKSDYSECKANWKLPDIVKEIISTQYK